MGNELSEKVGSSGFSMHQLHKVAVWQNLVWCTVKRIKDHSKISSMKSKFDGQLFLIYFLCTSCKREIILETKTKNDIDKA